jgi:hypothetical protein
MIILLTPSHKPKEASKSILKKKKKPLTQTRHLDKKNSINPHTKCEGADTTTLYTSTKKKTY